MRTMASWGIGRREQGPAIAQLETKLLSLEI